MKQDHFNATVANIFKILDTVEDSDSGTVFRPTTISSCRVLDSATLNESLRLARQYLVDNGYITWKQYTDEEIRKLNEYEHEPS